MAALAVGHSAQRGMAVISALLVATVVAVIAAGMIARQTQVTRGVESESQRVRGAWLSNGVLELTRQALWQQRLREPMTRLDQDWAQPMRGVRLGSESGVFDGRISDEQSKFNLRNLVLDGQLDTLESAVFERLCAELGVPLAQANRIVQRVIEAYPRRLQPASQSTGAGTEFDSGRLTSPDADSRPLPATRPMLRHFDDLAGLPGIDPAALERLRPFVTVLPAITWVNGNTTTAQVLAARVPGMSVAQAQALIAERDRGQWFINSGDYLNRLRVPQMSTEQLRLGITSEWFLLRGQSTVEQRQFSVQALFYRGELNRPRVIWSRVGA
ncbi:type II secretion system minor pseudopilin GspK [Pseudomonas sp. Z1-6]|uniref:type II secretion system minor pseudopilin GspK n=1 Tax=unclassified Pseudomonas TaxID=196821 RepID=UPI003DA9E2B2